MTTNKPITPDPDLIAAEAAKATPDDVAAVAPEAADALSRGHGNPTTVVDPASELVDTDPNHVTAVDVEPEVAPLVVDYAFAGGSIGNENTMLCGVCSGLVSEGRIASHTAWHRNGAS